MRPPPHKINTVLRPFHNHWALVTGATSGIGLAYAHALAQAGVHLVLVARRQSLLDETADQLRAYYGIDIETRSVDISLGGSAHTLARGLHASGIHPRLMVLAAGAGGWGPFSCQSAESQAGILGAHVTGLVDLLRFFQSDLMSHTSSAVIIVSSVAGCHPVPTMAVYAAAKSFSQSLAQSLYSEWGPRGVYVQALMPAAVRTSMEANTRLIKAGLLKDRDMQDPEDVVRASLRGMARHSPRVITGPGSLMSRLFSHLLPRRWFLNAVSDRFSTPEQTLISAGALPPQTALNPTGHRSPDKRTSDLAQTY